MPTMARLSDKRTPFLKHPIIIDFLRAMATEAKLLSTTILMSSLGSAQVRSKVRADGNYSRPVLWKLARHMVSESGSWQLNCTLEGMRVETFSNPLLNNPF